MRYPLGFLGFCLALALAGDSALGDVPDTPERFSEHRHARDGRLLFLRNDAVQPTAAQVAARGQPSRAATLPVFDRAELNSPVWSNNVATARQFLAQHGARFVTGFPLTSAPPREREKRSPRGEETTYVDHSSSPPQDQDSRGGSYDGVSTDASRRLASPLTQGQGEGKASAALPQASATATTVFASTFSLDTDLELLTAERDSLGMTHIRFGQTHRGLPVFGTELTVHLDAAGCVSSAGGALAPDLAVDPTPTLTGEQAGLLAAVLLQAQSSRTETPEVRATRLCILAPGLLRHDGDATAWLVWEVRAVLQDCTSDCEPVADETFYLDAHTGALREQQSGFRFLNRQVYDCAYKPGTTIACQIDSLRDAYGYYFGRSEGQPTRGPCPQTGMNGIFLGSLDTDRLYDYLGLLHNYYLTNFNRDGGNARGGLGNGTDLPWTTTKGSTHTQGYPTLTGGCPVAPGTCFTSSGSVRFCLGMVIPDIVAHEYSHSISFFTHYTTVGQSGMVYSWESGSLQEHFSDLFGEIFERLVTGTNDWFFGNSVNAPTGVIRYLSDPPGMADDYSDLAGIPYADRYRSSAFYCGTNNLGFIYHNTTVPTKAAYLLAEGGRFNGCTVAPIGLERVAQIWYRAMTQYYSTTESYNGAYAKLVQSAVDLYGADSVEACQTTRALQAVELDQPGACSGQPARLPAALDVEGW